MIFLQLDLAPNICILTVSTSHLTYFCLSVCLPVCMLLLSYCSVPFTIGTMSLQVLILTGNPTRGIRPAVLQKGTQALLQFLRERIPGRGNILFQFVVL